MRISKTLALGAALGAMAMPLGVSAATTVGTATPGMGNCYPFGCNSTSSPTGQDIDYEQIFSASAFNGITSFNTISFQDSGLNYSQYLPTGTIISPDLLAGDYDISLFITTASLGSGYPISPVNNVSTFFDGHLAESAADSGFSISGSSYTYDPTQGNLVLEVVASNQAVTPNNGSNSYLAEDTSGTYLSRAFDETPGDTFSDGSGLVTSFSNGPVISAAPEPSSWVLMIAGIGSIGLMLRRARKTMGFRFKDALSA